MPSSRVAHWFGLRPGEGRRVFLLALNLAVLMGAYYLLKTLREPLVLAEKGGSAELKAYATGFQAVFLILCASIFGRMIARMDRLKVLLSTTIFFAINLVVFAFLFQRLEAGARLWLGTTFYVWLGCFNVMVVAQFWAFANDLYSRQAGERVFSVVAIGSAVGAVLGSWVAKPAFKVLHTPGIMYLTVTLLLANLAITFAIHEPHDHDREHAAHPVGGPSGWSLLLKDRYFIAIALLALCKNLVNSTGEYILDRRLLEIAATVGHSVAERQQYVAGFKSAYFSYVNLAVLVLQVFAVGKLVQKFGARRTLFVLPFISLTMYCTMAAVPILGVILAGKTVENSVDYSLQKTSEQMLFLCSTRQAKYKVKAIVDTAFVRIGDVASAVLVWVGTRLAFGTWTFIVCNVVFVGAWLLAVRSVAHGSQRRIEEDEKTGALPFLAVSRGA